MTSISELLIQNIGGIASNYAANISEPTKLLEGKREELKNSDSIIRSFDSKNDIRSKSLIAVDGGRTTQKLAGGDLIVVGATVGEGYQSKRIFFSEEEVPAEAFSAVIPHRSSNDNVEAAIMAAMELRLFNKVEADVKIIDGSYPGNASTILFALINDNPIISNQIVGLNNGDEDGLLRKALTDVLHPERHIKKDYVAVVKSDSSFVFSDLIFGNGHPLAGMLSDRILASRMLHPGELFEPRKMHSNPQLINRLRMWEASKSKDKTWWEERIHKDVLRELLKGKVGLLNRLDISDATEEGLLYTTYFKPKAWSQFAPAIKIEYVWFKEYGGSPLERGRELIATLDQDILDESVLEPWSQYSADRRAKDVSLATDLIKNYLIANAPSKHEAMGLLRNYRT